MKKVSVLFMASVILYACGSADSKTSQSAKSTSKEAQIASEICNCTKPPLDSLSPAAKELLTVISKSNNPNKAVEEELAKIKDPEQQMKVGLEFMSFGSTFGDESSPINQCLKRLDTEYPVEMNDNKSVEKILKELEAKSECAMSATLMRLAMNENKPQTK